MRSRELDNHSVNLREIHPHKRGLTLGARLTPRLVTGHESCHVHRHFSRPLTSQPGGVNSRKSEQITSLDFQSRLSRGLRAMLGDVIAGLSGYWSRNELYFGAGGGVLTVSVELSWALAIVA
jgi:hypothetical protein